MILASYDPALGAKILKKKLKKKNRAPVATLEKIAFGNNMAVYMENVKLFFLKKKKKKKKKKINFSFSEFIFSDFAHNKFMKFHHVIFHKKL
jgi:hypothetical protein